MRQMLESIKTELPSLSITDTASPPLPQLRDYQRKLLDDINAALQVHCPRNRVMARSDTGTGKSLMGAKWAAELLAVCPSLAVGWVTHRDELKVKPQTNSPSAGCPY